MRNLKFGLLSLLLFTYIFSATKITFAEDFIIDIPTEYFSEHNINNGNKSTINFNQNGINGYGLFFLGDTNTDNNGSYQITLNGNKIICNKKLKGYYTNNFLNFKIFPLDNSDYSSNGIVLNDGGLFYDCHSTTNAPYNGVYGYIKWTYSSGGDAPENTHEIRAGLNNGNSISTTSPLQITTQGNYRALSGHFQDYLAKNAIVNADFKERIFIKYPDVFFNSTNTFSGNQNEILFEYGGNDGFGLFFLGTGIENGPYEITDKSGKTLICSGQLNGYYSFSFNDFGMLPLDETTRAQHTVQGINSVTGGLYYNCKDSSNNIYTGVYGYLQRDYNYGNIHELRAGINSNGKFINQSPIEVIYSDNFRNINRTLSGEFHDNLSKESKTSARFFGDLGIIIGEEELKATGTLQDPYFVIPYESYQNAKIYVKSSKENTSVELHLTAFDNNGQAEHSGTNFNLSNSRKNFGFYSYGESQSNILGTITNNEIKSGTINAILYNGTETRAQTIRFVITGSSDAPIITVDFSGTSCSKTGVTITATSSGNIKYAITETNECNSGSNYIFFEYPENGIHLTGAHIGKHICFRATYNGNTGYYSWTVTGIDTYGPNFNLSSWDGYECQTGTLQITNREGVGCSAYTNDYYWNGIAGESTYRLYSGGIGNIIVTGMVKDSLGNKTEHTGQLKRQDSRPELTTSTLYYEGIVLGTTTLYSDLITQMGVKDGACGNSTINKTGIIQCTKGTGAWTGNGISITPPTDYIGQVTCTVKFADDEGNTVTGYVKYNIDVPPTIIITGPVPGSCSPSQTISATASKTNTTMQKCVGSAGDANVCTTCTNRQNYTGGDNVIFNSENDNGKYICFKATDADGRTATESTGIFNIDTIPPTVTIPSLSYGKNATAINPLECTTVDLSIKAEDHGCNAGKMTLIISGKVVKTDRDGESYPLSIEIKDIGEFALDIKVKDSAGNVGTPEEIIIKPTDVQLTGTGFSIAMDKIGENQYEVRNNWKNLTHSQAGDCENIRITKKECNGGGTRTASGQSGFIYQYEGTNPNNLYCDLRITDGDTTITVRANFYDCTREGVDECTPKLAPNFTECNRGYFDCGKSKYTVYEDPQLPNGKYTSGTTARIQINGESISTLHRFRYTCIEQGEYCLELEQRDYHNISDTLTDFIYNNNLQPEICKNSLTSSRSDRIPYPPNGSSNPDIFEIDLNGKTGHCNITEIPYGSKNQGTRKVWIELKDINGNIGRASTDIIAYTDTPPEVKFYEEPKMNRNRLGGPPPKNSTKTINSGNFTVYIEAAGANLPTGTSGQNHKYYSKLVNLGLINSNGFGLLWFNDDTLKDWLITHYGNLNN